MIKWRIYKEAVEEVNFKKLLKQNGVTKLPSGTQFKPDRVSWSKDGGYAGQKTLDKICSQLEDAGWKRGEWRTGGIPDGSAVTNSNAYTSPDGQLVMTYSEHYGATAHDNFYGFTFKLTGNPVNEADDSFTRGDRPQIYKLNSDKEFTVDEFVERIKEAQEEVENIIIMNNDVYNDEDGLEHFLSDLREGGPIEETFDVDFYMNQPAYDQLPEDIQKYVSFNTGTCNFSAKKWVSDIFNDMMSTYRKTYNESSRFGFNVGDMVELTKDKSNTFTGETVKAGTQGEVVAVDKPMPGVIKVKIEGGKVVSVPERQLKKAGEDEEPWKKLKAPEQPKRNIRPEKPEDYYMRPTSYGSPRYTGD